MSFLFGRRAVPSSARPSGARTAEAIRFSETVASTAGSISVYVTRSSTSKTLVAGLYTDSGGHPASLLASGSKSVPNSGRWVTVAIKRTPLARGRAYWIAVLSKGGTLDSSPSASHSASCRSTTDSQVGLNALPQSWPQSTPHNDCIAAYVRGWRITNGTRAGANPGSSSPIAAAPTTAEPSTGGTTVLNAPTLPSLPPLNTAAPTITGTPLVGDTLTASPGSWTGSPTSYAYQWQDCQVLLLCSDISGATGSSYTLQSSDVGDTVDVVVTATNAGGASAPATSAQTSTVQTPAAPVNTSVPTISGTAQQGDTLTASNGSWSNSPSSYGYQWQDCSSSSSCSNISGATGSSYALQSSDVGDTIDVVVKATNAGGSTSATSAQTGVVSAAGGGSSGSCSGSALCVSLPETSTTFAGNELGTQDSGYVWSASQTGPSGGPTVWQRLQSLDSSAQRQVGYPSSPGNQTWVSPINYEEGGSSYTAWNFIDADQALSMAPSTAAKDYDMQWPDPMFYCPSGSWATGCTTGGAASFADQSYGALASLYSNIVTYFTYPMAASGSGSTVTYTANSVTDTSGDLAGVAGDCITATVFDNYGSPEWVTGTIGSVSGNKATLNANWSTSESWSAYKGYTSIPSSTPAAGAAYNVSPCTPPDQLSGGSGAASAQPWPRPPSVGTVTHYELGNEPDDGGSGISFTAPSLTAPTPTLTGVNKSGGTLTPGDTYTYEIAAAGAEGSGADLWGGGGGLTTPGTQASITLPAGDNAVQVNWNHTSNDGLTPYAYVIYGRTSGSQLGLAAVGRDAVTPNASSFSWVDTGAITPSGSPSSSDKSGGGQPISPGSYVSIWNVVAPAMKAAASADGTSAKIMGPVTANPGTYSSSYVDSRCVTTNGLNSACANGDASWSPDGTFEQALITLGDPQPDILTFHTYGTDSGDCSTPESSNFSSVPNYLISHYDSAVKALDDARGIPIWITENNYNAGTEPAGCYEQMLQIGSAWLAYNFIEWTHAEPNVQALVQWATAGAATGEMFFQGYTSGYNSSNCSPQPSCANLTQGEPGLNYWTMYEIDKLMGPGHIVNVSNVPSGYAALAVQTGPNTVVLALVNTQQGSDNGNGASGTVNVQLSGATVSDTQQTAINGNTNMTNGPNTTDLGAQSSLTINSAGYEVDLIKFTTS